MRKQIDAVSENLHCMCSFVNGYIASLNQRAGKGRHSFKKLERHWSISAILSDKLSLPSKSVDRANSLGIPIFDGFSRCCMFWLWLLFKELCVYCCIARANWWFWFISFVMDVKRFCDGCNEVSDVVGISNCHRAIVRALWAGIRVNLWCNV